MTRRLLSAEDAADYLGLRLDLFLAEVRPLLSVARIGSLKRFDVRELDVWRDRKDGRPVEPCELTGPGVYVARCHDMIKIGRSERCMRARVQQHQTGNPYPVTMIGALSLDPADEGDFHGRFAAARGIGEWFDYTIPIEATLRPLLAACEKLWLETREAAMLEVITR